MRERGGRTGIESEKNANAPLVKRRRAKTRSGSETASQTVRREMLRFVLKKLVNFGSE